LFVEFSFKAKEGQSKAYFDLVKVSRPTNLGMISRAVGIGIFIKRETT